jgi:anti-anti-sigma regulatory factor
MSSQTRRMDDSSPVREIRLPRSFDITVVRELASDIRATSLAGLTFDASAVVKVDAAALQLLCATAVAARAQGAQIGWKNVPAVLVDAVHTLALGSVLDLPTAHSLETR